MKELSSYLELIVGGLAFITVVIFFILFGKKIIKWLLLALYDLFIAHGDGFSDFK